MSSAGAMSSAVDGLVLLHLMGLGDEMEEGRTEIVKEKSWEGEELEDGGRGGGRVSPSSFDSWLASLSPLWGLCVFMAQICSTRREIIR